MELTDIIMEAQQGWRRDEEGLTLELGKVMSMEHLAGSKVTNWYHTRPVLDNVNSGSRSHKAHPPGLSRSLSDGHLNYAAVKVDAALVKMSKGRSLTISGRGQTQITPIPKRRHVSEIVPPNLDIIREMVYEEDELAAEIETDIDAYAYIFPQDVADDDAFPHDNEDDYDDITEEEAKEFTHYRNFIRRLSENLNKDSLGVQISQEMDNQSMSDLSISSSPENSQRGENDANDERGDGQITFTLGSTPSSASEYYNSTYESEDNESIDNHVTNPFRFSPRKISRSISLDNGNMDKDVANEHSVVMYSHTPVETKPATDTKDAKKSGVINVFKGLRRSRKTSTTSIKSTGKVSSNGSVWNHDGGEDSKQENNSDADSDGFVDSEPDENENTITSDVIKTKRKKRKTAIPVSEYEDVNSIY